MESLQIPKFQVIQRRFYSIKSTKYLKESDLTESIKNSLSDNYILSMHHSTAVHAHGLVLIVLVWTSECKKLNLMCLEKWVRQTAHSTALWWYQYKGSAEGFQEDFQEQNKLPAQSSAEFAEAVWVKREFTGPSHTEKRKKKNIPFWHFWKKKKKRSEGRMRAKWGLKINVITFKKIRHSTAQMICLLWKEDGFSGYWVMTYSSVTKNKKYNFIDMPWHV